MHGTQKKNEQVARALGSPHSCQCQVCVTGGRARVLVIDITDLLQKTGGHAWASSYDFH